MVIGVLKSKGQSGGFGSRDDMICVPYTTCMKRLQKAEFLGSIDVSAVSSTQTQQAKQQITDLLRDRHRIAPGSDDDFQVQDMAEIAEGAADATNILTLLLGSIASISLLVGGIGIMNIMLVSVTETNPGDRHPDVDRRPGTGHPPPVPGRSDRPEPRRRPARASPWASASRSS